MAKGIGALFSLEARGSIRKTITFLNKRGSTIIQKIPKHPDAGSAGQLAQRAVFSYYVDAWNALSDEERAAYPGTPELTPYQHFMQVGMQAGIPAPEPERQEYWIEHDVQKYGFSKDYQAAQAWLTTSAYKITGIKLKLKRIGLPADLHIAIKATDGAGKPTGPELTFADINADDLSPNGDGAWEEINDLDADLADATHYAIVLSGPVGNFLTNYVEWRCSCIAAAEGDPANYVDGIAWTSDDAGSTWEALIYSGSGCDYMFEIWGY